MKVRIKRIDVSLPLPAYQTSGAVAFDFIARQTTVIEPKGVGRVGSNIVLEIPKGYMLILASRSSTPKKKGLLVPHGIGIIDQDYCGEKDELLLQVYNFTDQEVPVARGERMGQAVFVRIDQGEWEEVTEMTEKNRGGFGTTGQI